MKRRLLYIVLVLGGIGGAVMLTLHWYNGRTLGLPATTDEDVVEFAKRTAGRPPGQAPEVVPSLSVPASHAVRLAIGGLGFADDSQNRQLGDLLAAELSRTKGLELVERQSLDKVLRETEMSLSGLVRAKDAVRVGKLLRAEWFLLGTTATVDGKKAIVARIVDGKSGVMRNGAVFPAEAGTTKLAADLASFVVQSRKSAADAMPRVFLAVGAFEDVGVNNRYASLPAEMRSYLAAAYQRGNVTFLERDYVTTLLQEVRLDLAGLIEDSNGSPPTPMQSAFWLVDGFYQSYETSKQEVEVSLRISRIFGRAAKSTMRAEPGEPLFRKVKGAIDSTIAASSPAILAPTRRSEIKAQMDTGRELASFKRAEVYGTFSMDSLPQDEIGWVKRRRNVEEAIRAFETVLLLDHENSEARVWLGACLSDPSISKINEARNYYQEVADSPKRDEWTVRAMDGMGHVAHDTRESLQWFEEALRLAESLPPKGPTNLPLGRTDDMVHSMGQYKFEARMAREALQKDEGLTTNNLASAEAALFDGTLVASNGIGGGSGALNGNNGMNSFVTWFGTNRTAAAEHLNALMPKLIERFPRLEPHLLAAALDFQVDTNAPIISEFRRSLVECRQHPDRILNSPSYFQQLLITPYRWCWDHKSYGLAIELAEAKRQASTNGFAEFTDEDIFTLAYAHVALEHWKEALGIFEGIEGRPVQTWATGPWGKGRLNPFLPDSGILLCQAKLGLSPALPSSRFQLGDPCLHIHARFAFAASEDGIWLAREGQLIHLDAALKTNVNLNLPVYASITRMCIGPDRIWIGTDGAGLIEFDKTSQKCRVLTEKDGLLLNQITCLYLQNQVLWIGFGSGKAGGLGQLDLQTGRVSSFTPHLPMSTQSARAEDSPDGPPRHAVTEIVSRSPDEIWMLLAEGAARRYQSSSGTWKPLNSPRETSICFFRGDRERLIAGLYVPLQNVELIEIKSSGGTNGPRRLKLVGTGADIERYTTNRESPMRVCGIYPGSRRGGMAIQSRAGQPLQQLGDAGDFPSPANTIAVDGNDVWVAGGPSIVVYDLAEKKRRKICYIPATSVDDLQIAGGYAWIQFDGHLYRTLLSAVR